MPTSSSIVGRGASHDQNFKNVILDYPRQALELFSPDEATHFNNNVTISPIRQKQLKQRLGDRFRELGVPLLVEWPNGHREAQKLEVYARATRGLTTLDDNERNEYQRRYPEENATTTTLSERLRSEGMQQGINLGIAQGRRVGEATALKRRSSGNCPIGPKPASTKPISRNLKPGSMPLPPTLWTS